MEASNLQELKDAATELMRFTCNSCEQRFCEEDVEEEDGQRVPSPCSAIIRMRNALSANPIRNCDRFATPAEAHIVFQRFCRQNYKQGYAATGLDGCDDCELCETKNKSGEDACPFAWILANAEGGAE